MMGIIYLISFSAKIEKEIETKSNSFRLRDKIADYYYKRKRSFVKYIASLLTIYFLIISPLPFYIGSYLVVTNEINNSDAIVALTGPGEGTYYNFGYQKRFIEIKDLYNKKISNKIILISSVRKYLSETTLLKSLLVNSGINANDVMIINSNATNTSGLIQKLGNEITKQKFNKIIFLTSPYHSKRSQLIWAKKFPNLIVQQSNNEYFKNEKKWFMSFNNMKVIVYEYISIIYNFLKGNL
jgi:Uncharacterized conserved protein